MDQIPASAEQRKDDPLYFLRSEQFQEMLSTYQKLKPLEKDHPRKFKNQMNTYDFADIYPMLDAYLQTHDLSTPAAIAASRAAGSCTCISPSRNAGSRAISPAPRIRKQPGSQG